MFKPILFIALVGAGGWWYFHAGRIISEQDVQTFYEQQERAMLSRDPEALCHLLDKDFEGKAVTAVRGEMRTDRQNKTQVCTAYTDMYQGFERLGEKMGGMLQLDHKYSLDRVEIARDRKSATVDTTYALDVAGSIMNIRGTSTDTLVRRNGSVYMLRSEGRATMQTR